MQLKNSVVILFVVTISTSWIPGGLQNGQAVATSIVDGSSEELEVKCLTSRKNSEKDPQTSRPVETDQVTDLPDDLKSELLHRQYKPVENSRPATVSPLTSQSTTPAPYNAPPDLQYWPFNPVLTQPEGVNDLTKQSPGQVLTENAPNPQIPATTNGPDPQIPETMYEPKRQIPGTIYGPYPQIPGSTYGPNPQIPGTIYRPYPQIPGPFYGHGPNSPIPGTIYGPNPPIPGTIYGPNPQIPGSFYGPNPQIPESFYGPNPPIPETIYGSNPPIPGTIYGPNPPIPGTIHGPYPQIPGSTNGLINVIIWCPYGPTSVCYRPDGTIYSPYNYGSAFPERYRYPPNQHYLRLAPQQVLSPQFPPPSPNLYPESTYEQPGSGDETNSPCGGCQDSENCPCGDQIPPNSGIHYGSVSSGNGTVAINTVQGSGRIVSEFGNSNLLAQPTSDEY